MRQKQVSGKELSAGGIMTMAGEGSAWGHLEWTWSPRASYDIELKNKGIS